MMARQLHFPPFDMKQSVGEQEVLFLYSMVPVHLCWLGGSLSTTAKQRSFDFCLDDLLKSKTSKCHKKEKAGIIL